MKIIKHRLIWLVVALVLALSLWLTPASVTLNRNFSLTDMVQLLTTLSLISLLLERALEIFVTTWRASEVAMKEFECQTLTEKVTKLQQTEKEAELNQATAALEQAQHERAQLKPETQRLALWTGLALGVMISAVGIRTLEAIVDPATLTQLSTAQAMAFRLIDILLTGGLIAGGSDGIHKVAKVFSDVMEASSQRAKRLAGQ